METLQIPEQVATLINLVAERYGYYFAKRVKTSELMKATAIERSQVARLNKAISEKIGEWRSSGADTREEIASLEAQLTKARDELKGKSAPFNDATRPLGKAISYLDKTLIPNQLQAVTGQPVIPKFTVSPEILKAITSK
jgi:hypothetical protein